MKRLLIILGVLLVVVVIAVGVLFLNLGKGVKTAVEKYGPQYTGTTVSLNSVNLSPFSGKGSLSGLVVGNPQGFSTPEAFSLGKVQVAVDLESLTQEAIVIEQVLINGPEITYEQGKGGNNLKALQQNINRALGGTGDTSSQAASGEEGESKKLIIKELTITEGFVHYGNPLLGSKTVDVRLPDIRLYGIGEKSNGVTGAEAVAQVVSAINSQVTQAISQSGAVKDLTDQLKGQLGEGGDGIKDKLDGLKGMFSRD
jgi:hypothetical protein